MIVSRIAEIHPVCLILLCNLYIVYIDPKFYDCGGDVATSTQLAHGGCTLTSRRLSAVSQGFSKD